MSSTAGCTRPVASRSRAADRDARLVGRRDRGAGSASGAARQGDAELELGQPPRPARRRLGRDVVAVQRRVQARSRRARRRGARRRPRVRAAPAAAGGRRRPARRRARRASRARTARACGAASRCAPPRPTRRSTSARRRGRPRPRGRGRPPARAGGSSWRREIASQLVEVGAGGGREGLGDDVVARVEVVVQQAQARARLAGDRADRRLGEAAALDDAPGRVDQLGTAAVGPAGPRDARRGLGSAHPVGTCSGAAPPARPGPRRRRRARAGGGAAGARTPGRPARARPARRRWRRRP